MVEQIKKKQTILPIVLGLLFALTYYRLPLNYFAFTLFGFIGIILVLYDIKLGIFAGICIFPFMPDMLNLLFMIFLVGAYVFGILFKDTNPLTKQSVDMPIILYVIFIIISTITSIDPTGSFRDLAIHITSIGLVFVIVNSIHSKKDFNILITFLVISATLVALYGLFQYVFGGVEMEDKWVDTATNPDVQTRIYSVFGNPNIFAEYLIMVIPISISLFWFSRKAHKKAIFLITTLILVVALVLSLSRGGWLGFAFGIFIFVLLIEKRLLLLGIPMAIGGMFLLPSTILNRLLSIVNIADSSNSYRIRLWDITLDVIRDNWLVGVGFGHLPFKQTFETYIRTMPTYHAHNTYLETMAEMGILGFAVLITLIFIIYKYSIKKLIKGNDRYTKIVSAGVLSGLAAVLAHGAVENILYIPRIIITFWILVGLILSLMRISDKQKDIS